MMALKFNLAKLLYVSCFAIVLVLQFQLAMLVLEYHIANKFIETFGNVGSKITFGNIGLPDQRRPERRSRSWGKWCLRPCIDASQLSLDSTKTIKDHSFDKKANYVHICIGSVSRKKNLWQMYSNFYKNFFNLRTPKSNVQEKLYLYHPPRPQGWK